MQHNVLQDQIEASLPYFVPEDSTEDSVYKLLLADQIPPEIATQFVLFIPVAFGRVFMRKFSLEFPQTFTLHYTSGEVIESLLFSEEPVFCAATILAENIVSSGRWTEEVHFETAAWSPEISAVSQALVEGYQPESISLKALDIFGDIGARPEK